MADHEQDSGSAPFHEEGGTVIFNKPKSEEENARQRRENEQHEFARSQVKTNKTLAWFTGALMVATFCTIGVGIWQAVISQESSNAARDAAGAAKSAADTAADTLKEMKTGSGAQDTHTLAEQAKTQAVQTTNLAIAAKSQAGTAKISADAARDAANTAKETLHVSERAYLTLGIPVDDFPHKRTNVPVLNTGHIPSGRVSLIVHEATFRIADPVGLVTK